MPSLLPAIAAALLSIAALGAHAAEGAHSDKETQADVQRHRAMAAAHAAAAKCLESGQGHEQCQKQLQVACKGLALGKHCGMRHVH